MEKQNKFHESFIKFVKFLLGSKLKLTKEVEEKLALFCDVKYEMDNINYYLKKHKERLKTEERVRNYFKETPFPIDSKTLRDLADILGFVKYTSKVLSETLEGNTEVKKKYSELFQYGLSIGINLEYLYEKYKEHLYDEYHNLFNIKCYEETIKVHEETIKGYEDKITEIRKETPLFLIEKLPESFDELNDIYTKPSYMVEE